MAQFWVFSSNLPSHLTFANTTPHHHHPLICTITPPPHTAIHHHFQQHARNRATTARFRVFSSNLPSHLTFANATPHHHHSLICTITPPPLTAICSHFRWRAQNQA